MQEKLCIENFRCCQKEQRFVLTNVHEGLLDLLVGGAGGGGVVLALEPGADGLQGAVCAAPATVVKLVLDHRKAA